MFAINSADQRKLDVGVVIYSFAYISADQRKLGASVVIYNFAFISADQRMLGASVVIYNFAFISADQRFETLFLFLETKQKPCFTGSALFLCNQFKIKRSQACYWDC